MKQRLDQLLVARGLCESREKAQRAIMAGEVTVDGQVVDKAGTKIDDQNRVKLSRKAVLMEQQEGAPEGAPTDDA